MWDKLRMTIELWLNEGRIDLFSNKFGGKFSKRENS